MELKVLYQKMSELTEPECRKCRVPQSCCDEFYCNLAAAHALEEGVVLEKTGHPKLPFMGPEGCIVPPHLRPLCTLHVCSIQAYGCKPDDAEFTKQYFNLRDMIEDLELRRHYKEDTDAS